MRLTFSICVHCTDTGHTYIDGSHKFYVRLATINIHTIYSTRSRTDVGIEYGISACEF